MLDIKQINKLAIVVGGGDLPLAVVNACLAQGIDFILVGIKGASKASLINKYPHIWLGLGEIGRFISEVKGNNIKYVCFAGAIKRPSLFSISFDSLGKQLLATYLKSIKGDNSLLSLIANILENDYAFKVIAPQSLDSNILSNPGNYTSQEPTPLEWQDIIFGFNMAKNIGNFDIGQSIIVQQNLIVAVEAAEGTDRLIKRSKKLLKKKGSKGILIKVKKPNQEERIDLPTIGLTTIKNVYKSGLSRIVIEDGTTLVLDKEKIIKFANKKKLFVISLSQEKIQALKK